MGLPMKEFHAIHHGHHQVQYNDRGWRGVVEIIESFAPIGSGKHSITAMFQQVGESLARVEVIVDDEDFARSRRGR